MSRTLSRSVVRPSPAAGEVQHLVMEDASWELYENFLRDIGDRPLRVTYDNGRMEIMAPMYEHEEAKKLIARMIEELTLELNIAVKGLGSLTIKRKDLARGLEPDECYFFSDLERLRASKKLDSKKDPAPGLVVEIDITSRSIERKPIYAAMGVPEIWRYDGRQLQCLHLVHGQYQVREHSLALPFLEPAELQRFIDMLSTHNDTEILKAFRSWVKKYRRQQKR